MLGITVLIPFPLPSILETSYKNVNKVSSHVWWFSGGQKPTKKNTKTPDSPPVHQKTQAQASISRAATKEISY
jgi:hypothetical protein